MTAMDIKSHHKTHHRANIGKNKSSKRNKDFANIGPSTREPRKRGLTFRTRYFQFLKNNRVLYKKTDSPLESFFFPRLCRFWFRFLKIVN